MKKIFNYVIFFICTIVGVSFITGNEVYLYFAQYSNNCVVWLIGICFLMLFCLPLYLALMIKREKKGLFEIFSDPFFSKIFKIVLFLIYFVFSALMLSGLRELFGLTFVIILVIGSFFILKFNLEGLLKLSRIIFVLICVYIILLLLFGEKGSGSLIISNSATIYNYFSIIPYTTLNVLLPCGCVHSLINNMSKKQIVIACLISSLLFCCLIVLECVLLKSYSVSDYVMPLNNLANTHLLKVVMVITAFSAMYSSFLTSVYTLYQKGEKKKNNIYKIMLLILIFICSLFRFDKIIEYSYIILGALSCAVVVIMLLYKKIKKFLM